MFPQWIESDGAGAYGGGAAAGPRGSVIFALPFVVFIAAGLFLRTFGLDAEEYARVRTELDARRLGAS